MERMKRDTDKTVEPTKGPVIPMVAGTIWAATVSLDLHALITI